jgi:hypothetical protein
MIVPAGCVGSMHEAYQTVRIRHSVAYAHVNLHRKSDAQPQALRKLAWQRCRYERVYANAKLVSAVVHQTKLLRYYEIMSTVRPPLKLFVQLSTSRLARGVNKLPATNLSIFDSGERGRVETLSNVAERCRPAVCLSVVSPSRSASRENRR